MQIINKFNGYSADGRRIYRKGGGDGGAGQMESDRQARVRAAVDKINEIFNGAASRKGVGKADALVPGQKYYLEDGSEFIAPNPTLAEVGEGIDGNGIREAVNNVALNSPDNRKAQDLFNSGKLFTGVEETPAGMGRDPLYKEQREAVYDLNKIDVDRQFQEAERTNRFSLARNGLSGGSVDIDSNADLSRRTNEGLMKAAGIADQSAADLQAADERTRANLISTAQSGIDTGQAASMALAQLDSNAKSAAGARAGASVGNLFNDMAQAYLWNQQTKGAAAGASPYGSQWYGVSSPTTTYKGS